MDANAPAPAPSKDGAAISTGRPEPSTFRQVVGLLGLVLFCLAAFVPGLATLPPVDRDEPRYTQATKQMLETGDVIDIRFQDEPRHKKPVGIYWLQASAAELSGAGAAAPLWVYRLPSLMSAIAAALLTFWASRAFLPFGPALMAGFLTASLLLLGFEARVAKTDAVLLATVVAAAGALARIWLAARADADAHADPTAQRFFGAPLILWAALAVGILVKGPITPMIVGLAAITLLVFDWRHRRFVTRTRPLPGLLLTALIAAPWFIAIGVVTDGAFYVGAVGEDLIGKTQGGAEGHWGPPLYHLAAFFVAAWPLSAFIVLAAPAMARLRRAPVGLFTLAWALPAWLVFEIVPTKLPHYTLPLYPALAILLMAALADPSFQPSRLLRRISAGLLAIVAVGAVGAGIVLPLLLGDPLALLGLALAVAGAGLAILAARRVLAGAPPLQAVRTALAGALLLYVAAWGAVLPGLTTVWVSPRLAAAFQTASDCPDPVPISVGFREPSLVFLTRTDIRLASPAEAVEALQTLPCAIAAVDIREAGPFQEAVDAANLRLDTRATLAGFNISKGDFLDLTLYQPVR